MSGCVLIDFPFSTLVLLCECPLSMIVLLDNAFQSGSCKSLRTFWMLDNECLWWENMDEFCWDKAFHRIIEL